MTKFHHGIHVVCITVIAAILFTAGCSSSQSASAANTVTIAPAALLTSIITSIQNSISRSLVGWEWSSYLTSFGTLLSNAQYTIVMQKVTYQSTGADGNTHTMTGLLILPQSLSGAAPSVPILLYQHGTEPYRPFSPSQFLTHMQTPSDYPEVMVAAAIASSGYAVAMTDYEGMGDNTDTQPYVHGTTLANQVIGMLRASRDIIAGSNSPCTWNNQLFLMGYSEGGYVTMTTTRELQLNHSAEFTVTASAPLSGPHDLSGAMRTLMLSDTTSKNPYFLPFLLTGYYYASSGTLFNPATAMIAPFNTTLPPLFTGTTTSDTINEAMGMNYDTPALIVPKSVLTTQFIDQLNSDTSSVVVFLRANDSYRNWVPAAPMRMYHHRSDDLVPYANSQAAFDAFSSAGAKYHNAKPQLSGVELVEELASITPSSDPAKTIHVSAALPELSSGFQWLNNFKK